MKVLLLNPPSIHGEKVIRDNIFGCFTKSKADYVWPAINLALFGQILKEVGMEPLIMDCVAIRYEKEDLKKRLKEYNPDYVVVVTGSATFDSDCKFVNHIRTFLPDIKTVFIGNHITKFPEESLKDEAIDYLILGEPELTFKELFDRFQKKKSVTNLKGIAFRKAKGIQNNGISDRIDDLDVLPFADRDLLPKADYFNPFVKKMPYITMNTSRGCPFPCIYCAAGMTYGKKFRARSPKNIVEEIEMCVRRYNAKEVFFRDEEFVIDKKRVEEFSRLLISRNLKVRWICNSRVDSLNEPLIRIMKRSGCGMLKIGVESGSDRMLKNMKKQQTVKQIKDVFRLLHKYKIDTVGHFIIGMPGETKETLEETRKLIYEIKPTYVSLNIATPYPGTELYDNYIETLGDTNMSEFDIEKGFVTAGLTDKFCDVPRSYLESYYKKIQRDYYMRPAYLIKKVSEIRSFAELSRYYRAGKNFLKFAK